MTSPPIAVVGLGCVLPDAFSPAAFQANLFAGRSAIRDVGTDRPGWRRYLSQNGDTADKTYTLLAAPVVGYAFDWRRFRIPPNDAATINPMQLMGLDAGDQALRSVRVVPGETAGVFIGATGCGWQPDSGLHIRLPDFVDAWTTAADEAGLDPATRDAVIRNASQKLRARLKPVSDDTVVNAAASVIGGRIAMHHDLKGMHYAVDAGYASALAALSVSVRALQDGTVDLAVAGGVSELLTPLELVAFARLGGLARTAVSPFAEAAEGTLLGEGAVMFALKRLEDAERDGETIHAIVLGIGEATDPPERSLLAPSECGQESAIRGAYERAGVSPSTVSFISCHATGTRLGDTTEVRALASVFGGQHGRVALCSAKPFVGHLRGASGAVGLLHAILAIKASCLPAQINVGRPHPDLALDDTPFLVPTRHQRLKKPDDASALRAGVSAFGFGGASYHAVLEAHTPGVRKAPMRAARTDNARIAIVGMGGVMPGARDVASFWTRLLEGYDAVTDVPSERWPLERFHDEDPRRPDTTYSKLGAFLEEYPQPRPQWRMPPSSRANIDPEQMVLLQAAEEAVADAGYEDGRWKPERVMVSVGFLPYQGKRFLADLRVNHAEYAADLDAALLDAGIARDERHRLLTMTEQRFKRDLPPITEDALVGWLGNIAAARVARRWGFRGAHFCVDSACASSHAALHAGVQALRHGTADVAIVGGVWCDMMPEFYVAACRFNALSPTGITPFDERADGFVPGEGAGVVVLRRLPDAERDGDRIHALLLAVHGSSDGRGRSVLAPKPEGEASGMQRALAAAAVTADSVDYVECHGTGTALGDNVEIQAITRAYGGSRTRPLLVGSVKSNYGHLNAAAGMPALIKSVLAVREGIIPPTINCERLNPDIDFASCPVQVVTRTTEWTTEGAVPRRAGVSGFGVGGTNMHLIIEEYRPAAKQLAATSRAEVDRAPDIAAAAGADIHACIAALRGLVDEAESLEEVRYSELLAHSRRRTVLAGRQTRVAIVATSAQMLRRRLELLEAAARRRVDVSFLRHQGVFVGVRSAVPNTALLFPGQGPQYPGMLRDVLARFPSMTRTLERVDAAYEQLTGRRLSPTFLDDTLPEPEDVHCAVFAVSCVVAEFLKSCGVRFDAVAGQSAGELAALVASEVLTLEDGLRAIRERTLSVLELSISDPGRMIALSCSAHQAAELCARSQGVAYVAADNSPVASIVSADSPTARRIVAICATLGIEATELDVSHGYHSPIIADARPRYERTLQELRFKRPVCDVVSTITGRSIRSMPGARFPKLLAAQFVQPVRLRDAIETLHGSGIRLFVECGPKWPLTTYVGSTLAGRDHEAQATLHPKTGEVEQLHRALACLFVAGVTDLDAVNVSSFTS